MSKKTKFANPALKKSKAAKEKVEQFNLAVNVNSFNAVFDLQKLDEKEEAHLEEILENNWIPDNLSETESKQTLAKLKSITSEIKSISRQGAFLVGERVTQAREMLKPYRDGTFTLWLESTFGSRRSGYNMLTYYELFTSLPDEDLRRKYKIMPQRAAYSLANRRGDLQKKMEIIDKYFGLKSNELISIVQKEFSNRDGRSKKGVLSLINRLLESIDQLVKRKKELTKEDLDDVRYAKERLSEILKRR
ncbi:MAG: CT583 family protein [Chlamydiia bacterium]|nr:CT583 family protein [Chlamydiia bacterium]MCB1115572.1 CT583 family protein [Chlamydiia bacterium]MCB9093121.1 CT583 family protein [Halobacteriovoraceae bacterium]